MFRKTLLLALTSLGLCTAAFSSAEPSVGIVNFATCITESKLGKQEQGAFESLKKQMTSLMEDTEKKLSEIALQFNDSEYMDGLSPEAEDELKARHRTLSEEMGRYQNQYYQVMQQANMKVLQNLSTGIQEAADKVAKTKKLSMVMNKEACFFYAPTLDVTNFVIAEMDKIFDQKNSKAVDGPKVDAAAPKPVAK